MLRCRWPDSICWIVSNAGCPRKSTVGVVSSATHTVQSLPDQLLYHLIIKNNTMFCRSHTGLNMLLVSITICRTKCKESWSAMTRMLCIECQCLKQRSCCRQLRSEKAPLIYPCKVSLYTGCDPVGQCQTIRTANVDRKPLCSWGYTKPWPSIPW